MRRWIHGVRPRGWNWRKASIGAGILGGLGLAFCCGRYCSPSTAQAAPPPAAKTPAPSNPSAPALDNARRPVAYIYGTQMISREELGEYLIAREGAAKLQFLVNRKIIETACRKRGIDVTPAEVDASLAQDLKDLQLTMKQFENRLLKQYRKSLYEWKEDVIWPKLALTKLARDRIKVEAKDLDDAFNAYHGEKVDGRMILFKPEEKAYVLNKIYAEIRGNEAEFNRYAKMQASPTLAARGGRLERPIGRNTTGDAELEKEIFALKEGEVSSIIERPEGIVVFKCDKRIPRDDNAKLEDVRAKLEKEIVEKKIQAELPKIFEALRVEANATLFIKQDIQQDDMEREVKRETDMLNTPGNKGPAPKGPHGN